MSRECHGDECIVFTLFIVEFTIRDASRLIGRWAPPAPPPRCPNIIADRSKRHHSNKDQSSMRTSLPSALLLSSSFLDRHVAKQLPRSRSRRLLASTGGGAGGQIKVEDIAKSFREGTYKRVLVVSGAGVSCSAGIPDFRTPGSGLYSNLNAYSLPYPEGMSCPPPKSSTSKSNQQSITQLGKAIFELDFFRQNPQPFVTLAEEIWPGVKYRPTITHCFFSLLDRKGLLQRLYT